ncbi:hypothetical protein ACFV23_03795 [Streptomyces sp. NPDC059627]
MAEPAPPSTGTPDAEEPTNAEPPARQRRRFDPTVVVALVTAAASIAVAIITVTAAKGSEGDDPKPVSADSIAGVESISADPYAQGCGVDSEPVGKSATKKGAGTVQVFQSKACHRKWVVLTQGDASLTFYMARKGQNDAEHRLWGTVDGTIDGKTAKDRVSGGSSNLINAFHTPMISADFPVLGCVEFKGGKRPECTTYV